MDNDLTKHRYDRRWWVICCGSSCPEPSRQLIWVERSKMFGSTFGEDGEAEASRNQFLVEVERGLFRRGQNMAGCLLY